MTTSPVTYKFPSCPGRNISSDKLAVKIERCLFTLKFDVKMWRVMISEIHSDDDPEER
jgi:hypothetical protein